VQHVLSPSFAWRGVNAPRTRIMIADDHPVVLVGVRKALELDGDWDVVGEAHSGCELVPLAGRIDADVILLDLQMPSLDGLDCLDRLRARDPDVKVVMLASQTDPETVAAAFEHGACGFIVKNVEVADLGPSIHAALDGGAYRPYGLPGLTDALVAKRAGLSKREFDILAAVARGLSNREIAHELWISEPTVKFHLTSVYRKLDVPNRTAAARWALENGIQAKTSDRP